MPTLIASVFNGETQKPVAWKCSACEQAFSHDSMREPSISELHKINANFAVHCQQNHRGESVIGVSVPKLKEDASQTAARVVREATDSE